MGKIGNVDEGAGITPKGLGVLLRIDRPEETMEFMPYELTLQSSGQSCCGAQENDRLGNEAQAAGNLSDLRAARGEADETMADAGGGLQLVWMSDSPPGVPELP